MPAPLAALRSAPDLAALSDEQLEPLAAAFEVRDEPDGTVLLARGDTAGAFCLVLEGEVEETRPDGTTRRLGPGSWLASAAALDAGPSLSSFAAAGKASVGRLSPAGYRSLAEHPELAVAVGLSLGTQLAKEFRAALAAARESARVAVGREDIAREYDVVVIGAGPHALAYATWIKQDRPETTIALVDRRPSPGFKIGESTLGQVVRAGLSLGVPIPVWRRLFNNKLGLHFWWMGDDSDELHMHIDHVVEETFQLERRVFETLMLAIARRAGVDVYQGVRVKIDDCRLEGQPKELVCESAGGDMLRFRSRIVCDASGPAAVVGRHLGIRRKFRDFNTNAYFGYFRKRSDVDLPTWDVAATRHLCFPEGWVWFIELASWEKTADDRLAALVDGLLDVGSPNESDYPTRFELAEQFGCTLEQFPISVGVVPRADVDTAVDLPLEERFQHYVNRYPVFKRIMDTYELIEQPYPGLPSYISYTDLTQHSDRYAGDGWLLLGDAAFFVNPFYSPGMTYGHSMASFAAKETVNALERGDVSEQAFAAYDEGARGMFAALVAECEAWYRSFRHQDAYERALQLRVGFFLGLQHQRILQFGGVSAMRRMVPIRPPGPPGEAIMNPRYQQLIGQIIDVTRRLEAAGADPAETGKAVKAIIDPVIEESAAMEGVAALGLGNAFQYYDDRLRRVPRKEPWPSLVPAWKCARCGNRTPIEFETCYVCGDPPPAGVEPVSAPAAALGPPGKPE